jgi:hypothetical protein
MAKEPKRMGDPHQESSITFSQMRSQKYREDEDSAVNRNAKVKSNNVYFSDSAEAEHAAAEVDLKLSGPDSDKLTQPQQRPKGSTKKQGTNRSLEKEFDIVAEKYP